MSICAWESKIKYKNQVQPLLNKLEIKNKNSNKKLLDAISETIELLDSGKIRVAEKKDKK